MVSTAPLDRIFITHLASATVQSIRLSIKEDDLRLSQDFIIAGNPTVGWGPLSGFVGPKVSVFIPTFIPPMTSPHDDADGKGPPHCTVA